MPENNILYHRYATRTIDMFLGQGSMSHFLDTQDDEFGMRYRTTLHNEKEVRRVQNSKS